MKTAFCPSFLSSLFIFHVLSPVRGLSGAVSELPGHQLLVAVQCKLGSHQEAPIEVRKAVHLEQRRHRRQHCVLLLCSLLGLGVKEEEENKNNE